MISRHTKIFLLLLASISFSLTALAQTQTVPGDSPSIAEFEKMADTIKTDRFAWKLDPAGKSKFDSVRVAEELRYYRFTIDTRIRAFHWQYISTIIIFFVVIAIVLMGLYLSYRQFVLSHKTRPAADIQSVQTVDAAQQPAAAATEITTTTLELNTTGIKINTAVIGLLILTISVAFFFMYLKFVYTIQELK